MNKYYHLNKYLILLIIVSLTGFLTSCKSEENGFDASGVFEATEIVISSEAMGVIQSFDKGEGDDVVLGEELIKIEVTDLDLQREQIEATIEAVGDKTTDPKPQIDILQQQLLAADASLATLNTQMDVLKKEQVRMNKLFAAKAATQQAKDDIDGKVDILESQISTAKSNKKVIEAQINSTRQMIAIQNRGISSEKKPLEKSIAQIENRLSKTTVESPINGTILSKYAFKGELVTIGKPLMRLADLSKMELRAYIDGSQLSQVKLGQNVDVYIDKGADEFKKYNGRITSISEKAEFTPKSIQTKDERANLVYAIKIKVDNDGYIKIGMYGEVDLKMSSDE
jgi:HlyD family secretion protein